jgi:pyruvate kinase
MNERKAKIVCTIGPSTCSKEAVLALVKNGMDIARLNFSHGTHESHKESVDLIRECAAVCGRSVAILQDLQGIKIRVGKVKNGQILLRKDSIMHVMGGEDETDEQRIYISYPNIVRDAKQGDKILIDDGLIQLQVIAKENGYLKAKVVDEGILKDKKGVNLPFPIDVPALTDNDAVNLEFGLQAGVDYVAISFVRSVNDILRVKDWLKHRNATVPLIAKIEKQEAIDNIEGIIDEVDGIMVARGDLGVEVSPEAVPVLQKSLINLANRKGKLVITATQMLESMTEHARPTRAEAGDVANAVIDGTDALMLSGETASGKHPVETVQMMNRIISFTENRFPQPSVLFKVHNDQLENSNKRYRGVDIPVYSEAVASAACRAAEDINAKYIVTVTRTGQTARLVSKFRPKIPIIAFTPEEKTARKMAMYWGVHPYVLEMVFSTDDLISAVEQYLLGNEFVRKGDRIVLTASSWNPGTGDTNFMKLHNIGEKRSVCSTPSSKLVLGNMAFSG